MAAEPVRSDFTDRLPAKDLPRLLSHIQQSAAQPGVWLGAVTISERAPVDEQLSRVDVEVPLRGSFPKAKAVIADVIHRSQNVT